MRTSPDCISGTDRVAEVARQMPAADIVVNVQGDEPEISGEAIDQVVGLLEANPSAVMATLAAPIRTEERLNDPSCVKGRLRCRRSSLIFQPQSYSVCIRLEATPAA